MPGSGDVVEASATELGVKRKQQRNKRAPRAAGDKPPSRYKKRKKEEEEKQMVYSNSDTMMTLKQVPDDKDVHSVYLETTYLRPL